MSALAAVGGDRALALARDAWEHDASDQVRAAALVLLVRLRDPSARDVVLRGLGTPSYRDVIQNAAVGSVVQRPDSGLIAALAAHTGSQPLPSLALAALVDRGDTTARQALRAGLDDDRPWVREYSLDAVQSQLEADTALALLQEAAPSLRSPEARSAVQEAIDRLSRPPS